MKLFTSIAAAIMLAQPAAACNNQSATFAHANSNLFRFNNGFRFGPQSLVSIDTVNYNVDKVGCKSVAIGLSALNYHNAAAGQTETDLGASIAIPIGRAKATAFFENWGYWREFEDDNQIVGASMEHPGPFGTMIKETYRNLNMKRGPNGHNIEGIITKPLPSRKLGSYELQTEASLMAVAFKDYFGESRYPGYAEAGIQWRAQKDNHGFWLRTTLGYRNGTPLPSRWLPAVTIGADWTLRRK